MFQFFINILMGTLAGIIFWVPAISIFLYWWNSQSGSGGWIPGNLNTKGAFFVLLTFGAIQGLSIGLGNSISHTDTATGGAIAGVVVTEILIGGTLLYFESVPEAFRSFSDFMVFVSEQARTFVISSEILLIPSALIGAATVTSSIYLAR